MATAFSPDGQFVVGGTSEGRLCVWRVSEYKVPTAALLPLSCMHVTHCCQKILFGALADFLTTFFDTFCSNNNRLATSE